MADSYKIYDLDGKIAIEFRPNSNVNYTDTKYIEKSKFSCTNSGTDLLIYNKYTTFPTTDNYFMAIPFAEITFPVLSSVARMATIINLFSTSPNAGVYTPTLTNTTNISASTAYPCNYIRVNNVVNVSGRVDIDQTAPGAYELGISLIIASDFTLIGDCAGTGTGNASGDDPIFITADTANDRASLNASDTDASNHAHYFHFTYTIK